MYTPPNPTFVESDMSSLSKLQAQMKNLNDILPKLLSLDEKQEVVSQEMSTLITSSDNLEVLVIAAACTDNMKNLVQALMRYVSIVLKMVKFSKIQGLSKRNVHI